MPENTGSITVKPEALAPLYAPWEEPNRRRVGGGGTMPGRMPSSVSLADALRGRVRAWRAADYPEVSDTTRHLLRYWFGGAHSLRDGQPFRYYYCQREAIETLIYLHEARESRLLPEILANEGGEEIAALGLDPEHWRRPKFAFKMATGAGKTKCMSLAMAWSYFHARRESDSDMPTTFVVIAPNLTVFERLRADFRPESGPGIYETDPVIPPEWRGDWDFRVFLQNESVTYARDAALFLTNIHRLHPKLPAEDPGFAGPRVVRSKALENNQDLLAQIAGRGRVMVINDEAHHVWDPGSAWNDALRSLDESAGVSLQLDFSATPKDNSGRFFQHIVCDYPLGEAVDAGIVKTPIIGRTEELDEIPSDNAAEQYGTHLQVGYQRWLKSREEWEKSGKTPLMFVMCESTKAADEIAAALNKSPEFSELNGKALNLHIHLKGRVRVVGKGKNERRVFMESDERMSDEDMRALRRISRELDSPDCPYACVVSVLMLREGWDVRNVTTVVPLRPYSSKANILPEQTLGRGLRRMTPPVGGANEVVVVIDHPAFANLYNKELAAEGMNIPECDADNAPQTTVTIYPDPKKDRKALDIAIPALSPSYQRRRLGDLSIADIRAAYRHGTLPLGEARKTELKYQGRLLITDELVEEMNIHLPLLKNGFTAIPFLTLELERICGISNAHATLAPLVEQFLCEVLFGKSLLLNDPRLVSRLADSDVRQHVRAAFVPLIRARTVTESPRQISAPPACLGDWRPYQATSSERSPALSAEKSVFNLTPCNLSLEVEMTRLLEDAPDVSAFAKNAGPQALRIDYLASDSRVASYAPDFLVRDSEGRCYLVETKGRVDLDVPRKAATAQAWCRAASEQSDVQWEYVYATQGVMEQFSGARFGELREACRPALDNLQSQAAAQPELPFYDGSGRAEDAESFYPPEVWNALDEKQRESASEALGLLRFCQKRKSDQSPAFIVALKSLERRAKAVMIVALAPLVPKSSPDGWFSPPDGFMTDRGAEKFYKTLGDQLRYALLYGHFISPIGMLARCLECALKRKEKAEGVFAAVREKFRFSGGRDLLAQVRAVNKFRNSQATHDGERLKDSAQAEEMMRDCVKLLADLSALEDGFRKRQNSEEKRAGRGAR